MGTRQGPTPKLFQHAKYVSNFQTRYGIGGMGTIYVAFCGNYQLR